MNQRQRGRSLSADGIAAVRKGLSARGWSNQFLADETELSVSTIKRMLRGEPKDTDTLDRALGALGLMIDPHLEKIQLAPPATTPALPPAQTSPEIPVEILPAHPNLLLSFYMNATYQDTKIPQIRCALTALKEQLVDSEVIFDTQDGRLTVSGVFTPDARCSIEATIRHLERLFTSCKLTGDILCITSQQPLLALAAE